MLERDVWSELVEIDNGGRLVWKPEVADRISGPDFRGSPARYVSRCGFLPHYRDFSPLLDVEDLVEIGEGNYITMRKECVRVDGLLRVVELFDFEIPRPDDLLLIGALTPNSFLAVLSWLERKGCSGCNVNLIDKSLVPVETIRVMLKRGLIPWDGSLQVDVADVLNWSPMSKPDLIIGDILNTWMVPHYFCPDSGEQPYLGYTKFLSWVRNHLNIDGLFLSRCLVLPEENQYRDKQTGEGAAERRVGRVISLLEGLSGSLNLDLLRQDLSNPSGYAPPVVRNGQMETTLRGRTAEEKFIRFYEDAFKHVDLITIRNQQSGYCHLNFLCSA
jgi:hypothetical protein